MFKLKKRCIRCLHILRDDGTCPNEKCPKYVPDKVEAEPVKTNK